MRERRFLEEQRSQLHAEHIAPITALVDSLRQSGGWLPYVAPIHGGIEAQMLSVLRDPGPATRDGKGSGMLCVENDDQSAAMTCELMTEAGLRPSDFTPWNAYPWYINRAPTDVEIASASEALVALVRLLPRLRVVMLQGSQAQRSWKILMEAAPDLYNLDLFTIETYHPSVQALRTRSVAERRWRIEHRKRAWRQAAALLR